MPLHLKPVRSGSRIPLLDCGAVQFSRCEHEPLFKVLFIGIIYTVCGFKALTFGHMIAMVFNDNMMARFLKRLKNTFGLIEYQSPCTLFVYSSRNKQEEKTTIIGDVSSSHLRRSRHGSTTLSDKKSDRSKTLRTAKAKADYEKYHL